MLAYSAPAPIDKLSWPLGGGPHLLCRSPHPVIPWLAWPLRMRHTAALCVASTSQNSESHRTYKLATLSEAGQHVAMGPENAEGTYCMASAACFVLCHAACMLQTLQVREISMGRHHWLHVCVGIICCLLQNSTRRDHGERHWWDGGVHNNKHLSLCTYMVASMQHNGISPGLDILYACALDYLEGTLPPLSSCRAGLYQEKCNILCCVLAASASSVVGSSVGAGVHVGLQPLLIPLSRIRWWAACPSTYAQPCLSRQDRCWLNILNACMLIHKYG